MYKNHFAEKLILSHPFWFNLEILVIFLAFFLLKRQPYKKQSILPFELTDSMRGFSILLIIMHHLCRHVLSNSDDMILFYQAGSVGVAVFLFLSGYGLTESFKTKELDHFFYPKIKRIYFPFWFCILLCIALNYFLSHKETSAGEALLYLWGIRELDVNYWFVPYLLILYLAFYFIFKFMDGRKSRILAFFLFSLLVILSPYFAYNARINAFSFFFGIVFSYYAPGIENYISKLNLALGFLFIILLSSLAMVFYYDFIPRHLFGILFLILPCLITIYFMGIPVTEKLAMGVFVILAILVIEGQENIFKLSRSLSSLFSAAAIIVFFKMFFKKRYSYFLAWFGKISFELFLLHGMFMYSYDFILFRFPLYISFPIYLTVICCFAYLLHWVLFLRVRRVTVTA